MKYLCTLLFLTKLFCFTYQQQHPTPSENFVNHLILVEPDVYHLYWNYNETDITGELHVKQTGVNWIGFGLSRNGGMYNSVRKKQEAIFILYFKITIRIF
jgi:hypothetical protein